MARGDCPSVHCCNILQTLPANTSCKHLLTTPPANFPADLTCDVASSEDGSMVKKVDPESGAVVASATTKHYVPVLELFRGHWFGIIVQACYEACE
jgi:hypothetical protein